MLTYDECLSLQRYSANSQASIELSPKYEPAERIYMRRPCLCDRPGSWHPRLPRDSDLGNLVPIFHLPHTDFTYHRTWETGLGAEIRVAAAGPAFFCLTPKKSLADASHLRFPLCPPCGSSFFSVTATRLRRTRFMVKIQLRTENRELGTVIAMTHPDYSPTSSGPLPASNRIRSNRFHIRSPK